MEGNVIEQRGVYQLIVCPSVRKPDASGNYYIVYNTVTDVVEEEVTYAPQAYNYLEQLSAEWDARKHSEELETAEADGKVSAVASLRQEYEH